MNKLSGKVLIVVPPFGSIEFPSLEASVLAASLRNSGLEVQLDYLNQEFAAVIGKGFYNKIANIPPWKGIADWVAGGKLSKSEFPPSIIAKRKYSEFEKYATESAGLSKAEYNSIYIARDLAENFICNSVSKMDLDAYLAVFVCVRHQQLASAIRISEECRISGLTKPIYLFGQYLSNIEQAEAILESTKAIDGVVLEDAPTTIAESIIDLLDVLPVDGVKVRSFDYTCCKKKFRKGNTAFLPDYSNYYKKYTSDPLTSVLPVQGSHGCWWSDKSQCVFCGLIEKNQLYISTPGNSHFSNVVSLIDKHQVMDVVHADHLINMRFYSDFLPTVAESDIDVTFFFEIRANTNKEQLEKLKNAKVLTVEIGIESLDSDSLSFMNKGVSLLQNLNVLKWCLEFGIRSYWTHIYGFQNETNESLSKQCEIMRKCSHLQPPLHATPIRLERNSPLFENPEKYGIEKILPIEAALHTYPFELKLVDGFVRMFSYETSGTHKIEKGAFEVQKTVAAWKSSWNPDSLYYRKGPSYTKICDLRDKYQTITLTGWKNAVFLSLDKICTFDSLFKAAQKADNDVSLEALTLFLKKLSELDLIFSEGDRWLSIVPRINHDRIIFKKTIEASHGAAPGETLLDITQ